MVLEGFVAVVSLADGEVGVLLEIPSRKNHKRQTRKKRTFLGVAFQPAGQLTTREKQGHWEEKLRY